MMCKEIFAVVVLILTGCLSAMALHTGTLPKNINKRQTGSVCGNDQQLTIVPVDKTKALPLAEFSSAVNGKLLKSALFIRDTEIAIPSKSVRIENVANSDNYEMTTRKKPAQSSCTAPQTMTLEPISQEVTAVFTIQRDSNDYLVAMFSSCTSKYIWRLGCGSPFDGTTFECPRSETSLDLFLVDDLHLDRAPMAGILEDLKEVTMVEWTLPGFSWRFDRSNDHCEIP